MKKRWLVDGDRKKVRKEEVCEEGKKDTENDGETMD